MKPKFLNSMLLLLCLGWQSISLGNVLLEDNLLTIFDQLQNEEVEEVTISLPIDSLMLNKRTLKKFDGKFTYQDKNGIEYNKSIKISPRGKSRRKHCAFPPLRLSFSKDDLQHHGLRKKHRSLKLVTHCNLTEVANDNVLKEYLTYKIYNTITEHSLNVQLLKIKYIDTEGDKELTYYGFLLEDIDALAERLGGKEINTYGKELSDFETSNVDFFTVFQFMIGNDDWQVPQRRNLKYIQLEQQHIIVPYDFDMTGMVAVPYARPNASLGVKSVTQRLFMGDIKEKARRNKVVKHFRSKRKSMYQLIDKCNILSTSERRHMKNYLMSFFEIIGNPSLLKRAIPLDKKTPEITELDGTMQIL